MPAFNDMDVDSDIPLITTLSASAGTCGNSIELQRNPHFDELEGYRNNANRVLQGSFPIHHRPRNTTASVLMVKWQDDDLGVNSELARLRDVFHFHFHFETEIWEIPSWRAAQELSNKIYEWKHKYSEEDTFPGDPLPLLILFYGGHAEKVANSCRWRSNLNPTTSVFLNWSTIQRILFDDADADVLILLDTCYAGSARSGATASGKGTKEILAACGDALPAAGVEHRSFTSLLTDELEDAAHENRLRGKFLTVVRLHGDINDNDKIRTQPFYAMVNKDGRTSIALVPFPVPGQRRPGPRITATYSVRLSIQTSARPDYGLIGFLGGERSPPSYMMGVKIEDIIANESQYQPDASITLVSRPLSLWDRGWSGDSCFKCGSSNEKCTPGQPPCRKCRSFIQQNRLRVWTDLPTSTRLEGLFGYFLPTALTFHLSVRQVRAFLVEHVRHVSRILQLRLSIGFGEPWKFWAVELDPKADELYKMHVFETADPPLILPSEPQRVSVTEHPYLSPVRLTSPPIVPIWVDPLLMQINIDCWLDGLIWNPDADWQSHIFPDSSQIWQMSILDAICHHYQAYKPDHDRLAMASYQTLRWALKLVLLNYVMGHPFLVPESDTNALFRNLANPRFRGRPSEGLVCPRAANKYLKMIILPMMRLVSQRTLGGLHTLLLTSGTDAMIWDYAFAITFLCLTVVSNIQNSLFELAAVCMANNDSSFGQYDAASEAQSIDRQLVVHLVGMFHHRFQTKDSLSGFNPLERNGKAKPTKPSPISPFASRVRNVTELYFRQSVTAKVVGDIGAERLLAFFMVPFYQEQAGPATNVYTNMFLVFVNGPRMNQEWVLFALATPALCSWFVNMTEKRSG